MCCFYYKGVRLSTCVTSCVVTADCRFKIEDGTVLYRYN
jgi:hypothetical protein